MNNDEKITEIKRTLDEGFARLQRIREREMREPDETFIAARFEIYTDTLKAVELIAHKD